jgi:protein-S-isoprenylcysteine O-methyltransferase Ste14
MKEEFGALIRGFAVSAVFVALQIYFLPLWFGLPRAQGEAGPFASGWRMIGLVPCVAGAVLMLLCIWDFGAIGRGTPAPFDPPRRLVNRGTYAYVRNPMYLGMALFLTGEALLLAEPRIAIFVYAAALIVIVNLFVLFYEEPTLRKKFGADYETYCAHVRRWVPRLRPYRP